MKTKDENAEQKEEAPQSPPQSVVTHVLLIRHGENDWVGTDRLAGRTPGVHLNEKGQKQAEMLAETLATQPIAAIYSSPLERCLETAQPTAAKLGLPVQINEHVLEADYGEWQGQSIKELAKLPAWHAVQYHPSSFTFPGGETMRNMQQRAVSGLELLHAQHPNQTVAVFSHADIIRLTLAHYLGIPIDLFQRVIVSTASISVITFHNGRPSVFVVNQQQELPKFEIAKAEEKKEAE